MASIYNVNPSFVMESSGGGGPRNARCTIGQPPKTKKFRALVIVPEVQLLLHRKLDNIVLFEFNSPMEFWDSLQWEWNLISEISLKIQFYSIFCFNNWIV